MPLSDMADLHVSEFPAGEEAWQTVMLSNQCRIKANLAQRSAGELALQRNCSSTKGDKQGDNGLDHHTMPCKDNGAK